MGSRYVWQQGPRIKIYYRLSRCSTARWSRSMVFTCKEPKLEFEPLYVMGGWMDGASSVPKSVLHLKSDKGLTSIWYFCLLFYLPQDWNMLMKNVNDLQQALRERPTRIFNDSAKLSASQSSFHVDAARIWNRAPKTVTAAKTISEPKRATIAFVKTLPI